MINMDTGKVIKILENTKERTKVLIELDGKINPAINYNYITGNIKINDIVLLNTTAVDLNLGTGGYHFIIYNFSYLYKGSKREGHIIKCRYHPLQLRVLAAEEEGSPYHNIFADFNTLNRFPVIVGTLHSMLAPTVATIKYIDENIKIAYIMTDAASLPIYFSDSVYELKAKGLLDTTITVGHAFGGDIETVTIYNGIIAAKHIAHCDIAIVTMGPGIVGTSTPYGFTGIEQGYILDIINDLGGIPIGIPRLSFADSRERHKGISHHSLTVFGKVMKTRCDLILPTLDKNRAKYIYEQLKNLKINNKHNIIEVSGNILYKVIKKHNLNFNTMGRGFFDDPDFFITCGAAGLYGYGRININN